MTILQHSIAQAAAASGSYQIARSLRFNQPDTAYLLKNFGSGGNRDKWTLSIWFKITRIDNFAGVPTLFAADTSATDAIQFTSSGQLEIVTGGATSRLITNRVHRDVGAFMNVVITADTTNATTANKLNIYTNGVVNTYATDNRSSLTTNSFKINSAIAHAIGTNLAATSRVCDMYAADIRFIDNQALDPTSFGEFDANTGVWMPKTYSGTYGTTGFWLPFSDNTGADSFGIGTDFSASALNRVELGNSSIGYTILGTMTYASGGANQAYLRDNNASTSAADPGGLNGNTAMGYDFGRAIKIRKIVTITDNTGSGQGNTAVFNIQYSDDNSTWTTVTGSVTTHTISAGQGITNTSSIDDNGSHRYWRIKYLSGTTGNNCWIGTLDMYVNSIGPNSWYPVNFSVSAGVGNDSLVDTPTNYGTDTGVGGEVRGNYPTWNPLLGPTPLGCTFSDGSLLCSAPNGDHAHSSMSTPTTGKWYWEFVITSTAGQGVGIALSTSRARDTSSYYYSYNAKIYINGGAGTAYGASYTTNDVIGVALNLDAGTLTFYKNGVSQGVAASGVTGSYDAAIAGGGGTTTSAHVNFGQRPFAYAAPSGFKTLCSTNLPTPAIGATSSTLASKNMNIALYTGNGSTLAVTGLGFSPDLVWAKSRSSAGKSHVLYDRVRGNFSLFTDNTVGQVAGYLASLDSDGFTASVSPNDTANANGVTYVGWAFKGGGTGVSNTSGSVTSTVSANPTAGISIATYTAPSASGDFTFGHGLGVAPKLFITRFTSTSNWAVYHQSVGANAFLKLNSTDASTSSAGCWGTGPTSSLITVKQSAILGGAGACIAYAFAEVAGFSKFGSYVGNGSADGAFVYCGFRPRWVLIRNTGGGSWELYDTARDTYNQASLILEPNSSGAEQTAAGYVLDILSNGFKLRGTASGLNSSGATYIFAAFAESPFNYARAR